MHFARTALIIGAAVGLIGCGTSGQSANDTTAAATAKTSSAATPAADAQCDPQALAVVEQLGRRMRLVSVLAPEAVVKRDLASAYDSLVTPELLSSWQAAPAKAPGREVSNPWPARIDVQSTQRDQTDCRVQGDVVFVTSTDTTSAVDRRPVTIRVRTSDGRITAYDAAPKQATSTPPRSTSTGPAPTPATVSAVTDVVRHYYDAIQAHDYDRAFAFWSNGGRASGQTRAAFEAGFAQTAGIHATISDSVRVEGAAGSEYATVPVVLDTKLRGGREQHFEGTYTLRRSMVDGATAEQRAWRIYTAKLRSS